MLAKIIKNKKAEVKSRKKLHPLRTFRKYLKFSNRDFKKAISKRGFNIIGEIKKVSPSEGLLRKDFDFVQITRDYERSKVAALSVVTDEVFFAGNVALLSKIRKNTRKPMLRKDFIIDAYQIYESRYYGADAVLLIAALLDVKEINEFLTIAKKYHMDCIVEAHDEKELKKVLATNADIIGINNRNLKTMKIDMETTLRLVKKIRKKVVIVAESGYDSKEQIQKIKGKVNAVLVGTSLIKSDNIRQKVEELL
ncbi:MAG TPA: indole-3-glycerol phosphate synthase TrpC [Candidatus Nanoarchaeia archaeon]|nr:indole-3-glycerol phosphate synthase TrpC [Candidatus Nanoarchaeia archaeon]